MIKLKDILLEVEFDTYQTMVSVVYSEDTGSSEIAEMLRAMPGVTTVAFGTELGPTRHTFKIKLITQKTAKEAFDAFRENAVTRYPPVKLVNVDYKSIENK